jgi:hypothetical protein
MENEKTKNIHILKEQNDFESILDNRSEFGFAHTKNLNLGRVTQLGSRLLSLREQLEDDCSNLTRVARVLDLNMDILDSWIWRETPNIKIVTRSYYDSDDKTWSDYEYRGFSDESMVVSFQGVLEHWESKFKSKDGKWINPALIVDEDYDAKKKNEDCPLFELRGWDGWASYSPSKHSVIALSPLSMPLMVLNEDMNSKNNPYFDYLAPIVQEKLMKKNPKLLKRDEVHIKLVTDTMTKFANEHLEFILNNYGRMGRPVDNKCMKYKQPFGSNNSLEYIAKQLDANTTALETKVRDKMIPVMMGEISIDRFVEGWGSDYDDYLRYSATLNCLKPIKEAFAQFVDEIKNPNYSRTIIDILHSIARRFGDFDSRLCRDLRRAKSNREIAGAKMSVSNIAKLNRANYETLTIQEVRALLQIAKVDADEHWLTFNINEKSVEGYDRNENEAYNRYIAGLKRFVGSWRRS